MLTLLIILANLSFLARCQQRAEEANCSVSSEVQSTTTSPLLASICETLKQAISYLDRAKQQKFLFMTKKA